MSKEFYVSEFDIQMTVHRDIFS